MITIDGYAKDSADLLAEGVVITWGEDMVNSKGGLRKFLTYFNDVMKDENTTWLQKCKNRPTRDIVYVYIIVANRLYARGYYGGHEKGNAVINTPGNAKSFSQRQVIDWPRIVIAGPIEKCPFKRELRGFQGFRYCTKLF